MNKKTLACHANIWKRRESESIVISMCEKEKKFKKGIIRTVNNKIGSKRRHEKLYLSLMELLKRNNFWR